MLTAGSRRWFGFNRLTRPADAIYQNFKDDWDWSGGFPCGVHAELDCYRQTRNLDLSGSVIYVAGAQGGYRTLPRTKPCSSCQAVLDVMGVKWAIFNFNNEPRKMRVSALLKEWMNE